MITPEVILITIMALVAALFFLGIVTYDKLVSQPKITTVAGEESDICSDLPKGWQSFVVHQRNGYAWLIIEDPNGNFSVVPYLNADGSQNQAAITDYPY